MKGWRERFELLILHPHSQMYIPYDVHSYAASGTGVRQSQERLEKPGGATRQGCDLGVSVSTIVHDR